jgi:hypothetical protein
MIVAGAAPASLSIFNVSKTPIFVRQGPSEAIPHNANNWALETAKNFAE